MPIGQRTVVRAANRAAQKAGLDRVAVHTLRHSAATAVLEARVHITAASNLLGHADARIAAAVHGHVSSEVATAAMASLAGSLGRVPPSTIACPGGPRRSQDRPSVVVCVPLGPACMSLQRVECATGARCASERDIDARLLGTLLHR